MRIGIECRALTTGVTGIGRYLSCLLEALSDIDKQNEYFLFADNRPNAPLVLGNNFHLLIRCSGSSLIWEQWELPWLARKNKIDLMYYPRGYGAPWLKACRIVLTVHDLYPKLFPAYWRSWKTKMAYDFSLGLSIQRADRIIADSEYTKEQIIGLFKIKTDKISVIPLAAAKVFKPREDRGQGWEGLREKWGITSPYLLHIGGHAENKNTLGVIKAFANYCQKYNYQLQLIVVCDKKWIGPELQQAGKDLMVKNKLIFTGAVSDHDLADLYRGSLALVFPSFFEGFGLPVMEAMACGTPVITSNRASLPEVAGDAAIYVNPDNLFEIQSAIEQVAASDKIRESLIQKGLARTKQFSWESSARILKEIFEEAIIGHD